jgi:hypothetical protein
MSACYCFAMIAKMKRTNHCRMCNHVTLLVFVTDSNLRIRVSNACKCSTLIICFVFVKFTIYDDKQWVSTTYQIVFISACACK